MQIGIIIVCCVLLLKMKMPLPVIAFYMAIMQLAAVLGAMWAVRLRSRVQNDRNRLPLSSK